MFLMLSKWGRERYKIQLMRLKFVVWSFYSKGEWSKNSYSGGCCASSTSYFVSLSLEQLARQGQLQSLFCFFIVAKIHSWQDSFFVVTNGRDYHKGVMRSKQTGELGLDLIRSKKYGSGVWTLYHTYVLFLPDQLSGWMERIFVGSSFSARNSFFLQGAFSFTIC